jgi:dipeptidyl-peptidase-4
MKHIYLSVLLLLSVASYSQNKKLSIDDAVIGQRSYLQPKRLSQLQWIAGTTKYSYIVKQNNREVVMVGEVGKPDVTPVFASDLVKARLGEAGIDSLEVLPPFVWENTNTIRFIFKNRLVWLDIKEEKIRTSATWDDKAENIDVDPIMKEVAYTVDNNLFILNAAGEKLMVSNDDNKAHMYGSAGVHRNEYGISKGTFWSPRGTMLAYYRMDESMVTEYPILNIDTRPASVKMIRYPMAGDNSHQVTVGIYNRNSRVSTFLNIAGDAEHYITNISWSRDESKIYLALLNRRTDSCWYQIYDANTGNFIKTWAVFTAPTYVEPLLPLQYLGKTNKMIWRTYELAADKKSTKEIIKIIDENGNILDKNNYSYGDAVADVFAFNDKGYFFTYFHDNGLNKGIAYQPLVTGKTLPVIKLTTHDGNYTPVFCDDGSYYISQLQSKEEPRWITINESVFGKEIQTLLHAENPLKDYQMPTARLLNIKAADGVTNLNGRIIYPDNFDSTKRYPSITYVYNGPHVQLVSNAWLAGGDLWLYYMAQQGYVVYTLDGRGSGNRGKEFEQVIHRQLGTAEIADQVKGNAYLRSLKFIDTTRMGVFGWSFGGFMTTGLMTRTPGKYKVGVAGGAVIDWSYYEIMYTERYMDGPKENPEGYATANLLNYIDSLQGKLLMIHGTSDDVVVWQHDLMYIKKCVEKRKQVDYFVYPGHLHNVLGKDRVHLMQKVTDYFNQNL